MRAMKRVTVLNPLPARPREGHKGLFGRVLVVGGSQTMIGAPALSGTAALRSGAGLVQVAMPLSVLPFAISITPELIGVDVDAAKELQKAIDAADAIVLGPGLGQAANASRLVKKLARLDTPRVIDADALNLLSAEKSWKLKLKNAVLTPHPGEMKRLAKSMELNGDDATGVDSARIALAGAAAKKSAAIVVLKGHRTVVADGERVYVNRTGDSTLSKAGSGDVLCGVLAVFARAARRAISRRVHRRLDPRPSRRTRGQAPWLTLRPRPRRHRLTRRRDARIRKSIRNRRETVGRVYPTITSPGARGGVNTTLKGVKARARVSSE